MIRFKKGEFGKKLELALAFIKSSETGKEKVSNVQIQRKADNS